MKFMVTTHTNDSFYMLPREKQLELFMGADAFIRENLKSGKCKAAFLTSAFKGSVTIWEMESSEESARLSLGNPMRGYQDIESEPLIEYDVGAKVLTSSFKEAGKK